jgi:hypothetical protein
MLQGNAKSRNIAQNPYKYWPNRDSLRDESLQEVARDTGSKYPFCIPQLDMMNREEIDAEKADGLEATF